MMNTDAPALIEFKSFPERQRSPRFLVLHCAQPNQDEDIFCLTPRVMCWDEQIYLLDLNSCSAYWQQQAERARLPVLQLYERIIDSLFGDTVSAVFCDHPWPGLCLLDHLLRCGDSGYHDLSSHFNRHRYLGLDWAAWFNVLAVLGGHLEVLGVPGFRASTLRSKSAQLQRFIQRLDLHGPEDLADAEVAAVSRRYSGWIGEAWGWTFMHSDALSRTRFETSRFPWRPLQSRAPIQVKRHLDYPVSQWEVVEPLLQEDFTRLCQQRGWQPGDRINLIEWQITLFNMKQMRVAIGFRHPYALHHGAPHFKAALYQAYYAYSDMMQRLMQRDTDLDLPEEMPFISWQLSIGPRLRIPQKVLDLFADELPDAAQQQILDLQNCLPRHIEHYAIHPDFMPEQLFDEQPIGVAGEYDFSLQQWQQGLLQRPLFYYPQPLPIAAPSQHRLRFIERTADNWWRSGDTHDAQRDYFLLRNEQGEWCWVFRNRHGEWYRHGLYS